MNHVFMDFENVHQVDLTLIGAKSVSFTLMVGPHQTKLDSALVEKLMENSASVRLVKLKTKENNALDFALSYYLGRAVLADPAAYFHIIAKDKGYDPLIEHLRDRHINVQRHMSCAELTFTWPGKKAAVGEPIAEKTAPKKVAAKKVAKKVATKTAAKKEAQKIVDKIDPVDAWVERVLKDFKEHPEARPKTRTSLLKKVGSMINKPADGQEVQSVIARLVKRGKLKFGEKDIPEYHLK